MLTRSAANKLGKRKRAALHGLDSISSSGKCRRRAMRAALPESAFQLPRRSLRTTLANTVLSRARIVQCAAADGDALIQPNADDQTFRITTTVSVKLDRVTYEQMVRDWERMALIEMEEEQARWPAADFEENSSLEAIPTTPLLDLDLDLENLPPMISPLAEPEPEHAWAPVTCSHGAMCSLCA